MRAKADGWDVVGTYHSTRAALDIQWHRLDIRDRQAVIALVRAVSPTAIVHTAFQQRGAEMWATTAQGTAFVAQAAHGAGSRLVHLSSDAIFDGTDNPYFESAQPRPITPYGAAKAAAELTVAVTAPRAAIVRTSWTISRDPLDPHTRLILDVAAGRRPERVFSDEYRCPIGVDDLAAAVVELAAHDYAGIINVAGPDALSRYELGRLVAKAYNLSVAELPTTTVAASGLHHGYFCPTPRNGKSSYRRQLWSSSPLAPRRKRRAESLLPALRRTVASSGQGFAQNSCRYRCHNQHADSLQRRWLLA